MKLYYTPGACSMAVDIALREAGLNFEMERVDLQGRKTETGADYTAVNPKGYVPALQLDNGEVLTEAGVVLQYVADRKPESGLLPAPGTDARYRVLEWVHFIATELHKSFGALFNPAASEEMKKASMDNLTRRFGYIESKLGSDYLTGKQFTIADAYLGTVLGWCNFLQLDLSKWPKLGAYAGRVASRPKVLETMKAEGLM
jgi:glutathione S-transferase